MGSGGGIVLGSDEFYVAELEAEVVDGFLDESAYLLAGG